MACVRYGFHFSVGADNDGEDDFDLNRSDSAKYVLRLLGVFSAVSIRIRRNFEFDGCQVRIICWRASLFYVHNIHQWFFMYQYTLYSIKKNINKRLVNLKKLMCLIFFKRLLLLLFLTEYKLSYIRRRRHPNKRVAADAHRR